MINEKATGESRVPVEAIKALPRAGRKILLFRIIRNVYLNIETPPEWKTAILKCLHKKGDTANPNNWRGICLKDTTARLLSGGILNARLLNILAVHGIQTQFGSQPGVGCRDGLYTLRTALSTRRYHNQETYALFVDLVKAFNIVNHKLMIALLRHYYGVEQG